MTNNRVYLLIYDLSRGMARQYAPLAAQFLGGHSIDGIWHTSVVVFGYEYSYGQGIDKYPRRNVQDSHPVYGKPEKHIDMGETTLTPQILDDYMRDLKSVWTPNRYHIMDNNCNNFSNEVCYFLTNRNIPEYITDLPNNFMQSPLGMMLRPMIDSFFSSNSNTNSSFGDSEDQVVSSSSLNPEVKAERDFPVVELKTIGDIDSFVEKGSGILVIIKDASDSALLNSFRLLFRYKKSLPIGSFSKNIDRQQQLNFAKVHFNLYKQYSKSITEVYTNSIATFINGSIVGNVVSLAGLDLSKYLDAFDHTINHIHPHLKLISPYKQPILSFASSETSKLPNISLKYLQLPQFSFASLNTHIIPSFATFRSIAPVEKIVQKIKEIMKEANKKNKKVEMNFKEIECIDDFVRYSKGTQTMLKFHVSVYPTFFVRIIPELKSDIWFPLLDLMRWFMSDTCPKEYQYFTVSKSATNSLLDLLLSRLEVQADEKWAYTNIELISHILCNLIASLTPQSFISNYGKKCVDTIFKCWRVIVDKLKLSNDQFLASKLHCLSALSSVLYNISLLYVSVRLALHGLQSPKSQELLDIDVDENNQIEMTMSLIFELHELYKTETVATAFKRVAGTDEENKVRLDIYDIFYRSLTALATSLYFAPSAVIEAAQIGDIGDIIQVIRNVTSANDLENVKIQKVCHDVELLVPAL